MKHTTNGYKLRGGKLPKRGRLRSFRVCGEWVTIRVYPPAKQLTKK